MSSLFLSLYHTPVYILFLSLFIYHTLVSFSFSRHDSFLSFRSFYRTQSFIIHISSPPSSSSILCIPSVIISRVSVAFSFVVVSFVVISFFVVSFVVISFVVVSSPSSGSHLLRVRTDTAFQHDINNMPSYLYVQPM